MRPERRGLAGAAVAAFALGVGLMIPFEYTLTRLLGVIFLATFVVCGLRLVADPAFLERDRGEE